MPDPTPRGRIAALVGSHTVVRDGRPVSVYQAVGGQAVDDIAAAVADDVVAPLEAERDRLIAQAGRETDRANQAIALSQDSAAAAVQLGSRLADVRYHLSRLQEWCRDAEHGQDYTALGEIITDLLSAWHGNKKETIP